jgi:hypothetical protein
MSEPHDVVKLLAARMESNPEEFNDDNGRWAQWLDELIPFVTEEERVMLRKPMMQTIHEDVLDELLNGPEKRREAEENRKEYERHMAAALQHTKMQAMQQAIGQGIVGKSPTSVILDEYANIGIGTQLPSQPLTIGAGGKEAMRIQTNGDIQIGNETLNEGLLKSIKKALGL